MGWSKASLPVAPVVVLAVVTWLSANSVSATVPIQMKARQLGYPAQNCLYCHGEKLPKKGAMTHNDRGKWLVAEKKKRNAKDVDPAWLKDYVEPAK